MTDQGRQPAPAGRCARQCARGVEAAGYTLLEILAVILIISTLAGIGFGMFTRSSPDLPRSVSILRDFARAARAQARFYRAPARMVVTPPPGPITPDASGVVTHIKVVALRPVGEWNFDDGRAGGSRAIGGDLVGAVIDEGGRFGQALFPQDDAQAPGVRLDARTLSVFDLRRGFVARADIKLRRREACNVLRLGESWELGIDVSGRVRGAVTLDRGGGKAGRRVILTGVRRVPLDCWCRIGLSVDGIKASIQLDYIEESSEDVAEECWRDPQGWFLISDGGAPVPGAIDSVEVYAFDEIADEALPEFVEIVEGPGILYFDPEGNLDRARHPQLPAYRLRHKEIEEVVGFELGGLPQ